MERFHFITPKTVAEACSMLEESGARAVAGGTDVIPRMVHDSFQVETMVDLSGLSDLRYIRGDGEKIHIGALATHTDLIGSSLLNEGAAVLVRAAETVGAHQTRNRGTLGGNIANASPAGDTLPALLALNASLTLASALDERSIPLQQTLLGPGKTGIRPGELIREVSFLRLPAGARCAYQKMGKRNGMAIAVASAAVVMIYDTDGLVKEARVALGSVAPTAIRCPEAEAALCGHRLNEEIIAQVAQLAAQACSPISDIRSTAEYRRSAIRVLVDRALRQAA